MSSPYMVARYHYILRMFLLFLTAPSQTSENRHPKLFHTTWLSLQQNLYYTDFFQSAP